jgi:tetratricopeptide (TPR) repeat protein
MPEPITIAIILAKLGEHILTFFTERGEDLAADRLADLLKTPTAQKAIERTVSQFRQYEALGHQLTEWVHRQAVALTLISYRASSERRPESLVPLRQELEACGFDAAPDGPDAFHVIDQFFAILSECFIEDERATHSTARVVREIKSAAAPQNAMLADISETVGRVEAHLAIRPVDGLVDAEALLEGGKAQAALDLIEQLQRRADKNNPVDEYKLLATRGSALLQLNRIDEAEKSFREALTLRPIRPNAIANVGLCVLNQGKLDEADQLSSRALAIEAHNAQGLRVRAQVLGRRGRWDEALVIAEQLPEPWERDYLVGSLLLQKGDEDAALPRLESAYQQKTDDPWLTLRFASALLAKTKKAAEETEVAPWGKVPDETKTPFAQAEALVDAAVAHFEQRSNTEGLVDALAQRALLRSFLGIDGAKDDFDRIASLRPLDEHLLEHAANFWNSHGDPRRTAETIDAYRKHAALSPKLARLYAYGLAISDRPLAGVAVLRALPPDLETTTALADVLLQSGDVVAAQAALDSVQQSDRADWRYGVRLAAVQETRGDAAASLETLQTTLASASNADKWRIRLLLAEHYSKARDWSSAVNELGHVVTADSPAHFVVSYMGALYNSGSVDECLALGRAVRDKRGCVPQVARTEAQILGMLGRLDESDELYRQILELQPGDAEAKLQRAFIAFRRGDHPEALTRLPAPHEVDELAWDDAFQAAIMRSWLGDPMDALATAYAAFHAHSNRHEAHLAYLQVFFSVEPLIEDKFKRDEAGPGTWVTVEVRGREVVHRLLSAGQRSADARQHLPGSKFARAVTGRHKGEAFELDEQSHELAKVTDIRDQYVGLLQDIMQNFETAFPGVEGLRAFAFRGAEDLPAIQEVMAAKRRHGEEAAQHYRTMPMPLAMLAHLLGMTDLEAWYGVTSNVEFHPVLVVDGSAEAQATAAQLATDRAMPMVLETTAIAALAEFGMLQHLPRLGRPIFVAQTVVDQFEQARLKLENQARRGTTMTLEEKDGRLYRSERTKDSIETALALHSKTLAWLRDPANCTIAGVHEGHGTTRWSIRSMLSAASADSMALAMEQDAVLVSEDLRLRGLCLNEFGRPGIASPNVLHGLFSAEAITQDEHDLALIGTVQSGYYFTPVNDRIIECAFRSDGNTAGPRFRAVVDCLADPTANLPPVVNCAALFLKRLQLHPVTGAGGVAAVYLLSTLLRRGGWEFTERLLRLRLSQIMVLLPVHMSRLEQEIAAWKASQRFIH